MNRSAQPLHSGMRTKAGEDFIPNVLIFFESHAPYIECGDHAAR